MVSALSGLVVLSMVATMFANAAAADAVGPARVIDGDTIEIEGARIRLFGIDAPETRQVCDLYGEPYRCGQEATKALAERVGARPLTCRQRTTDRYGRAVAVCYLDDEDIGAWLVRAGWALSFRKYSEAYSGEEAAARRQGLGLWRGRFEPPWEWRQNR